MQTSYKLAERAVLMQLSAGMPGKVRKDKALSEKVKGENHLGAKSGAWVKNKYPDWALEPLEKLVTEARAYHAAVTLPYTTGVGILPAALIFEYGQRMKEFAALYRELQNTHFRDRYPEMIEWAKSEHNGTFDESDYPAVEEVMKSFYFRTEPVPVPDAGHFEDTVKSLLGVDAEGVNIRVQDAMQEAQRELMRRLIEPVRAMATRLSEEPKVNKKTGVPYSRPKFNDTLISNIQDIAKLAPKLNIAGDPAIDSFVKEMAGLTNYNADTLRESETDRKLAASAAMNVLKKLEGYKF